VAVERRVHSCLWYRGVAVLSLRRTWTMLRLMDLGIVARSWDAGVLRPQLAGVGVLVMGNVDVGVNFSLDSLV